MTKKPDGTKKPDSKPPADRRRPVYVTSRLRYFDGEFLKTRDFVDEQDYHVDRQTRHEARLHAPGILEGLRVRQSDDQADSLSVTVDIGSAVDAEGNQLLVSRPTEVKLDPGAKDGDYILDIKFDETPTNVQSGSGGATRFTQEPGKMLAIGTSLRPGAVPLATVRVTGGAIDADSSSGSGPVRKYAGVKLPGPLDNEATLRVEDVCDDPDGGPVCRVLLSASGGLELDGDGLWVPNTLVGSDGKVSIGKSYPGAPEDPLEVWDGYGDEARRLLGVTESAIHAYSNTVIGANGKVSIGKHCSSAELESLPGYLQVWSPTNDNALLSVTDDGLVVNGAATVGSKMSIGTTRIPTNPLEIYDGSGSQLLSVSSSEGLAVNGKATVSETLTASGGIAISATQIDTDGQVAIGKASGAPSNPFEVYDGTGSPLLAVSASGGLAVTGIATVSDMLTADGGLTVPASHALGFGETKRQMINLLDAGYGIGVQDSTTYFRSDHGFAFYKGGGHDDAKQSPGVDGDGGVGAHVLAVNDDDNVIVPNYLKIGEKDAGKSDGNANLCSPANPLEVYDGSEVLCFKVSNDGVVAKAHLQAEHGMTLNGGSSLFGKSEPRSVSTTYSDSPSDGFVVATIACDRDGEEKDGYPKYKDGKGDISGRSGGESRGNASVYVDNTDTRQSVVPSNSFTMPVRKGEDWVVYQSLGGKKTPAVNVYWIPVGN